MFVRQLARHGLRSVFLTSSVVVTTDDVEQVRQRVPACFELDTYLGRAAIATAFVESVDLRPAALKSEGRGLKLNLIETLAFCSYTDSAGRTIRGFNLLDSAVGTRWAQIGAKIASPYDPRRLPVEITHDARGTTVRSGGNELAEFSHTESPDAAVEASPFGSRADCEPFMAARSFNFVARGDEVHIMQGVLKHWEPKLMIVESFDGFACGVQGTGQPFLGFQVCNVPYLLRLGRADHAPTTDPKC